MIGVNLQKMLLTWNEAHHQVLNNLLFLSRTTAFCQHFCSHHHIYHTFLYLQTPFKWAALQTSWLNASLLWEICARPDYLCLSTNEVMFPVTLAAPGMWTVSVNRILNICDKCEWKSSWCLKVCMNQKLLRLLLQYVDVLPTEAEYWIRGGAFYLRIIHLHQTNIKGVWLKILWQKSSNWHHQRSTATPNASGQTSNEDYQNNLSRKL